MFNFALSYALNSLTEKGEKFLEQEIQSLSSEINNFQSQMSDYLPYIIKFCYKVIFALLVFWAGGKVIRWIVRFIKASMEKT